MTVSQRTFADGPLYPQHAIHCIALCYSDSYNFENTATVCVNISNGKRVDINQRQNVTPFPLHGEELDVLHSEINDVSADAEVDEGDKIP